MQITHFIAEQAVVVGLASPDRDSALRDIVHRLADANFLRRNPEVTEEMILDLIMKREQERATAMGEGVAFPHARVPGLQTSAVAIALLQKPVTFGDDQPVDMVFLMVCPADAPMFSLKAMAKLSQFLVAEDNRRHLRACANAEEVRGLLEKADLEIDTPIIARDIMRAPRWWVQHDAPATQIARYMYREGIQNFPVLDDDGKIMGDITANRLFRFGLPDFFMQLKSVSFVSEFDPFEKYFKAESKTLARDLTVDEIGIISPEHTILEIVFDLAIKKYPKLYVVDRQGRWIGTIDHSTVLNNVINY